MATAGATQGRAAGHRLLDETGAVLARKPVRACRLLSGSPKVINFEVIGGGPSGTVIGALRGRYERLSLHTSACGTGHAMGSGSGQPPDTIPVFADRNQGQPHDVKAAALGLMPGIPRTCKTRPQSGPLHALAQWHQPPFLQGHHTHPRPGLPGGGRRCLCFTWRGFTQRP